MMVFFFFEAGKLSRESKKCGLYALLLPHHLDNLPLEREA
jgi:hypothetical protein